MTEFVLSNHLRQFKLRQHVKELEVRRVVRDIELTVYQTDFEPWQYVIEFEMMEYAKELEVRQIVAEFKERQHVAKKLGYVSRQTSLLSIDMDLTKITLIKFQHTYLKINQKAIQCTFQTSAVKVLTASIQEYAHQTYTKQVFGWIQD